jgi:hemoglobin-like flavoprotein
MEDAMMTPEQVLLVQASWEELEPLSAKLGEVFYERLFKRVPEARALFSQSPQEQGIALMAMLGVAVNMLDRLDRIDPLMRTLGALHAARGVKLSHVAPFREALLETLGYVLGPAFTGQVREAWGEMFDSLMRKTELMA